MKKIFIITILSLAFIFSMSGRASAVTTCTRDSECTGAGQGCLTNPPLPGCSCAVKSSASPAQKPCALANAPCKFDSNCKITDEACFQGKSTSDCTCQPKSSASGLKSCASLSDFCKGKGPYGCQSNTSKPGETKFPCQNIPGDKYDESVVRRCAEFCESNGLPVKGCVASCSPCVQTVTAGCTEAGVCRDLVGPDYENVKSQCENLCRTKPCTTSPNPCPSGPAGASVEALKKQAQSALNKAGFSSPTDIINRAIKILMAFIGSISLVLYIYAGFMWMTASGNTEQVGKAKTTMVWTTLGIAMMLLSYMLVTFLFNNITGVTSGGSTAGGTHTAGSKCDPNGDFNKVWSKTGACTTKCEYTYPGNGQCMSKSSCASPKTTQAGLCPGTDVNFLCCKS